MAITGTMMDVITLMRFEPPKMTPAVNTTRPKPAATATPLVA